MTSYRIQVNGKEFLVDEAAREGTAVSFTISGRRYNINVAAEMTHAAPSAGAKQYAAPAIAANSPDAAAPGEVRAPMPGLISQVSVKNGDTVKTGQRLLVIEAMKMENNIAAPRDGTVAELSVKSGQEVENRKLLLKIV